MDKEENKTKIPCDLDHNGECLVCDCWISDCAYQRYLKGDYKYESKEELEHMFKDYVTKEDNTEPVILGGGYTCSVCGQYQRTSALCHHINLIPKDMTDKKYTIEDFLDMIHEFEEKELPNRNQPYHYEAEIAAGLKHFELFIKGKQLKDKKQ